METYCEGNEGRILPDPRTCTGFIQCVGSSVATMACSGGLVFNEATNTCDWPYNVKCRGIFLNSILYQSILGVTGGSSEFVHIWYLNTYYF